VHIRVVRGSTLFNPTQPNPYQSENLDPGPNPTHNPTDPIKTTTNLLVQERQLSNRSREEIRDAPNYKFAKQFDANICEICLITPWPSVSTTLVASMNSAHIKIFNSAVSDPRPNPTQQKSKNIDPTQSNPTRGLTQPMDNSELFVELNLQLNTMNNTVSTVNTTVFADRKAVLVHFKYVSEQIYKAEACSCSGKFQCCNSKK